MYVCFYCIRNFYGFFISIISEVRLGRTDFQTDCVCVTITVACYVGEVCNLKVFMLLKFNTVLLCTQSLTHCCAYPAVGHSALRVDLSSATVHASAAVSPCPARSDLSMKSVVGQLDGSSRDVECLRTWHSRRASAPCLLVCCRTGDGCGQRWNDDGRLWC